MQCASPLSMCAEQQGATGRGPLFAALVRPFRAPNLTGSWRKDFDASESLVSGRVLHAQRLLTACTAGRDGRGAPPALGAETRSGAGPGPAGERKHTWGGPPHTFASIAPLPRDLLTLLLRLRSTMMNSCSRPAYVQALSGFGRHSHSTASRGRMRAETCGVAGPAAACAAPAAA